VTLWITTAIHLDMQIDMPVIIVMSETKTVN